MVEDIEQIAMDAEESAAIEDVEVDYNDEPAGQIERFVKEKYSKAETARRSDGYKLIETIEVSMDLKYNLLLLKNLRYLLKLLKQKS